jgi:hypothetical protein
MGLTDRLWVMALAAFAVSVAHSIATVIWGTLLQRRVPPHLLGRVSSLDFFVSLALMAGVDGAGRAGGRRARRAADVRARRHDPVFLAIAAILLGRLPADEIAHPLDPPPEEAPAGAPATRGAAASGTTASV